MILVLRGVYSTLFDIIKELVESFPHTRLLSSLDELNDFREIYFDDFFIFDDGSTEDTYTILDLDTEEIRHVVLEAKLDIIDVDV